MVVILSASRANAHSVINRRRRAVRKGETMRRFLTRTAAGLAIVGAAFGMTTVTASPAGALEVRMSDVMVSSVEVNPPDASRGDGGITITVSIPRTGSEIRTRAVWLD